MALTKKEVKKKILEIEDKYRRMFINTNLDWTFDKYIALCKLRDEEVQKFKSTFLTTP